MILTIDNITYDTSKNFEDQDNNTKLFVLNKIQEITPTFNFDETNRPFEYVFTISNTIEIVKTQIWSEQAPSCAIVCENISMRNINE